MSTIDTWSFTKPELEAEYSRVLDLAVRTLIDDGLLLEDDGIMWAASHALIVRKRSQLSQWTKKLLGSFKDDEYRTIIVALAKKNKKKHKESNPFSALLRACHASPLEGGD